MAVISLDGLSFSGLVWAFKLYQANIQRPAYAVLGHLPVSFRDQHMVSKGNKNS